MNYATFFEGKKQLFLSSSLVGGKKISIHLLEGLYLIVDGIQHYRVLLINGEKGGAWHGLLIGGFAIKENGGEKGGA